MDTAKPSKRSPRSPIPATDTDGAAIVLVPLANTSRVAKLLAEDFARLQARGITAQWAFNEAKPGYGYVRCGCPSAVRGLVTVACLIMEPPRGFNVRYRDGDRTNLRRENLYLTPGAARGREAAIMAEEMEKIVRMKSVRGPSDHAGPSCLRRGDARG